MFLVVGKSPGSLLFLLKVANHQKGTLRDREKREVVSRIGRHVQFVMTPPRGAPLKSNSISMYFPFRDQRERDFASSSSHHPVQEGSVPHSSFSSPHTHSSQAREMVTHKSRGVVVANGLGIAKSCGDERGGEATEGRRGALEKGKERGLPVIRPISDFSS